jgi:hypothetical protein
VRTARNAILEPSPRTRDDVRPDHDRKIQKLVAESLENKSRELIAQRMTADLHWEITASMLDNFAAGGKITARFPASLVSAFCEACSDDRLRLELMGARLRKLVEFAQRSLAAAHGRKELRRLLDELFDEEDHA